MSSIEMLQNKWQEKDQRTIAAPRKTPAIATLKPVKVEIEKTRWFPTAALTEGRTLLEGVKDRRLGGG